MSHLEFKLTAEQKNLIERVKNSTNPTKTFFSYHVNLNRNFRDIVNIALIDDTSLHTCSYYIKGISIVSEFGGLRLVYPTTNKPYLTDSIYSIIYLLKDRYTHLSDNLYYNTKYSTNYTYYICLQYIDFETLRNLAVDYIFKICFEYFFKEGYINAYNTEYEMVISDLKSCGDFKQLQLFDLEFDVLQNINLKNDLNTYGGNTAYDRCCELKHYKKYLNRPLWDFMQYLNRVYNCENKSDFYGISRWSKTSEYIKQVFKQYMDKHLEYSQEYLQEYDTKWDYSDFGYGIRLAYSNYDDIYDEETNAYKPITFKLNHYSCKFGNNIAIKFRSTIKEYEECPFHVVSVPAYPVSGYHGEYFNKLFTNIIPIEYWNFGDEEIKINHIKDGYVKMDWQTGDKWKCWIPFAAHNESITYKFIELDENNKKIKEETEFTTISIVDENKCSDFETYRDWKI